MLKKETVTTQEDQITDLMKRVKGLQTQITYGINPYLTDSRKQIEALEKGFLADAPATWSEIDNRLSALEEGMAVLQNNQSALMKQYLDQQKQLEKVEESVNAFAKEIQIIGEGVADWGIRMEGAEDSIHALQLAISSQRIEVR